MGCKKFEKWLSDRIDEELSKQKVELLRAHLEKCASCQSYAKDLAAIQKESENILLPERSSSYWEEFTSRLKENISSLKTERKGMLIGQRWKLAWAGAVIILAVAVGLVLILSRHPGPQEEHFFSLENSLVRIYQEIGSDSELEEIFNSVILSSIGEALEESGLGTRPDFYMNPLFWEDLSEEELNYLESAIKEEDIS